MFCLSLFPVSCDIMFWCIASAFVERAVKNSFGPSKKNESVPLSSEREFISKIVLESKRISRDYFISRQMKSIGFFHMARQKQLLSGNIRQSRGTVDCSRTVIEQSWKPAFRGDDFAGSVLCLCILLCRIHLKKTKKKRKAHTLNTWNRPERSFVCPPTCPDAEPAGFVFSTWWVVQTDLNGRVIQQLRATPAAELLFVTW